MKKALLFVLVLIALRMVSSGGPPDGPYELYHENGQLQEKGSYLAGEQDGPTEVYEETGQLMYRGTLNMGEQCGEWIEGGETFTYDPCPPGN